ncbi:hypothetical protein ERJ75_000754300 [Trypanosoma vivax]|nr:hypothetical protein ERJ75_000754300 [Trypanosoma vivax]
MHRAQNTWPERSSTELCSKGIPVHNKKVETAMLSSRPFLWYERLPYRLVVSCLSLLTLFLLSTLYRTPEVIENERQRKAMLRHFLPNDYRAKEKGDIVRRPTAFFHSRKSILDGIKNFVSTYYMLANASIHELKHYYFSNAEKVGGIESLRRTWVADKMPEHLEKLDALLADEMNKVNRGDEQALFVDLVKPVEMNVQLFTYSPQEHRGPSPVIEMRFMLDEQNPLGPFLNECCGAEKCSTDASNRAPASTHKESCDGSGRGGVNPKAAKEIEVACAPRLDELTGRYYNPCRRRGTKLATGKNASNHFSLMDNVRAIQLRASLYRIADASQNKHDTSSGFTTVTYHWFVEETILFHPAGLVELNFDISTSTKHSGAFMHQRFFLMGVLLVLVLFDIVIRICALCRIIFQVDDACATYCVPENQEMKPSSNSSSNSDYGNDYEWSSLLSANCLKTSQTPTTRPKNSEDAVASHNQQSQSTNSVFRFFALARRTRRTGKRQQTPEVAYMDLYDLWQEQLQRKRGSVWHSVALGTDIIVVVCVSMALVRIWSVELSSRYDMVENMMLGVSVMSLSINMLSYCRYFPRLFFTVHAMFNVIPKLLMFIITAFPLFLGFTLFFCIVFGPHSNGEFHDIGFAVMALYFMMFGDSLLPAIDKAEKSTFVSVTILASLMTVIFLFLTCIVLNLAMSITQEQWVLLRRRFGACFSDKDMLLTVRSRDQVKAETLECIVENLEFLLRIRQEEEEEKNSMVRETSSLSADKKSVEEGKCDYNSEGYYQW